MPVSVATNATMLHRQQQQLPNVTMDDEQHQQQQQQQQEQQHAQQQNSLNNNNNNNNDNNNINNSANANTNKNNNNNKATNSSSSGNSGSCSNNNNNNVNNTSTTSSTAVTGTANATSNGPIKAAVTTNTNTSSNNNTNSAPESGCDSGGIVGGNTTSATNVLLRKQFIALTDADCSNASFSSASVAGSIQDDILSDQCSLTQAGLEEYNTRSSSFYDQPALFHHQKQSSYAQSEGYHSYVSSSDSTSATPFLDRLRQESELLSRQSSHHWSQNDLSSTSSNSVAPSPTPLLLSSLSRESVHMGHLQQHSNSSSNNNNSSESTSSTETLKWLGSMSDVSEASHVTGYSAISESVSSSQLIVHSSRVLTPKRHQSESVLYLHDEHHSSDVYSSCGQVPHQQHQAPISGGTQKSDHSPDRALLPHHRHSPSYPPMHITSQALHAYQPTLADHQQSAPLRPTSTKSGDPLNSSYMSSSSANCSSEGEKQLQHRVHKSSISVTITKTESAVKIASPTVAPSASNAAPKAASDETARVIIAVDGNAHSPQSAQTITHTSALSVTTPTGGQPGLSACRSNHRLFPVSTYTEPVHSNTSQFVHHPKPQYSAGLQKPTSNTAHTQPQTQQHQPQSTSSQAKYSPSPDKPMQPTWQSVTDLINDFERSNSDPQAQKYTFIEPSKTHRISNPALKAFQKNALQSYIERQQQQQQISKEPSDQKIYQPLHAHHHLQQQQQQLQRPHSLQSANVLRENSSHQQQSMRSSLPNTYSTQAYVTSPAQQPMRAHGPPPITSPKPTAANNSFLASGSNYSGLHTTSPSPAPPPPPPRSRSLMHTTLLRRSSSASDYAEFRDQYTRASHEKLSAQSVKNISSSEKMSFNDCGMPPPPPPPRGRINVPPTRRTSSASEYAAAMREKALLQQAAAMAHQQNHPLQHAPQTRPLPHSQAYHMPTVVPLTAVEGNNWAPERPPKNPNLRVPSPDLPPPPTSDVDSNLSDEPLPPPPPEILHRQPFNDSSMELAPKAPSPNRRNSFAGSSTRKAFCGRTGSITADVTTASKVPPLIPKKPTNIEFLQATRNSLELAPTQETAAKMAASRKRAHNSAATTMISMPPPIMENCEANLLQAVGTTRSPSSPPPPPLYPRSISNANQVAGAANNNKGQRCNSKASYLPRQSLEKLNNTDPDHGIYKLTLTSNEDLVPNSMPTSYEILTAHNGKLPSNLPDVLPMGAKLQQQPTSPTSSNGSLLRYGSNGNLNSPSYPQQHQQQQLQKTSPPFSHYPAAQARYSSPAMNTIASRGEHVTGYSRSQSFDANKSHKVHITSSPSKLMSQSTMDLKRCHHLEATLEEPSVVCSDNASLLLPAQSESNISCSNKTQSGSQIKPLSNESSIEGSGSSNNSVSGSEGRLFRAELVNATLSTSSGSSLSMNKSVGRKDSLRENIEKITQLQSKLMSAHMSDSSLMGSFVSKPTLRTTGSTTPGATATTTVNKATAQPDTSSKEALSNKEDSALNRDNETVPSADCSKALVTAITEKPALQMLPQVDHTSTSPSRAASNNNVPSQNDAVINAQISQLDTSTSSLKLVQRSELILRVNPTTTEASSQTDSDLSAGECDETARLSDQQHSKEETQQRITLQPRQPHPIEIDCDKKSQELASLLGPNDKLVPILTPTLLKSPTDYVSNLYNPNVPLRPAKRDVGTSTLSRMKGLDAPETQKVMVELQYAEVEVLLVNGGEPETCDLLKQKVDEFMKQLNRKIRILTKEQEGLNEESALNDELGNILINKLSDKVRPIEATKCRTYIDDVGHITSLLLSLSQRLAKAENALGHIAATTDNKNEKESMELKRDRLVEQLAEAKRLKEDIERRGSSVVLMLEKNLSADEFADFDYFINMKAKLIADARDIADKIKCGEEQLNALSEALIQSDC